jgi:hypothetical protein
VAQTPRTPSSLLGIAASLGGALAFASSPDVPVVSLGLPSVIGIGAPGASAAYFATSSALAGSKRGRVGPSPSLGSVVPEVDNGDSCPDGGSDDSSSSSGDSNRGHDAAFGDSCPDSGSDDSSSCSGDSARGYDAAFECGAASPLHCDSDEDAFDDFDADPSADAVVWPDAVLDSPAVVSPSAAHWQTPSLPARSQSRLPSPGSAGSPFLGSPVPHTPGSALPPPSAMHDGPPPPDSFHDGPIVWPETCFVCNAAEHNGDGSRLLCEMKACVRSFHVDCLPQRERAPARRCILQGKRWCCHSCRPAAPQDPAAALVFSPGAGADMPIEDDAAEEAGDAEVCLRFPFGALVREDALGLDFPGKPLRRNRPAVTVCSICQKKSRQRKVLHVVRSCAWCIASSCAACIGLPEEEGVREQTGHLQWLCPVDAHRFWRGAQGSAAECRVSAPHFELLRVAASGRKAVDRRQLTAPA